MNPFENWSRWLRFMVEICHTSLQKVWLNKDGNIFEGETEIGGILVQRKTFN